MSARLQRAEDGRRMLSGDLDPDGVATLYARTDEVLGDGPSVAIDLAGVDSAGSAGLALLLQWRQEGARRGIGVGFANLPDGIRRSARLAGVESLLPDAGAL